MVERLFRILKEVVYAVLVAFMLIMIVLLMNGCKRDRIRKAKSAINLNQERKEIVGNAFDEIRIVSGMKYHIFKIGSDPASPINVRNVTLDSLMILEFKDKPAKYKVQP